MTLIKKILICLTFFSAPILQAAEFEVMDILTVNGITNLKSSATIIVDTTVLSSIWISTSAVTPHLYISTAGNAGIGTAVPANKLHVIGGILATSSITANEFYGDGSNLDNVPGDNLGNHIATTTLDMADFDIVSVSTITVSSITTAGAGIVFSTHTYFMNGNVGIGTENPSNKFHIEGSAGGSAGIYLNSAAPSSTSNTLYNSGGTLYWNGAMVGAQTPWTSSINAAGYTLYGNDTANGNLTLDSTSDGTKGYLILNPTSGNVGIANTNPTYTLEVKGTFHAGPPVSTFSATGGTITTSGDYTIHTFTGSGTFTPNGSSNVEVLVVAGGGGGAYSNSAGGGGAGGLIYNSAFLVTAQAYTITVGVGGSAGGGQGGNGGNSVFDSITATGGGGGGNYLNVGKSGGSGGGGGTSIGTASPSGQGNDGGVSANCAGNNCGGGGGGGSAAAGATGNTSIGANGGDGLAYSISGASLYYAGGGGGGRYDGSPGNGGLGGGGNGGSSNSCSIGTTNTGGGGGGDGVTACAGGSGITIIRYLTTAGNGIFLDSSNNVGIGDPTPSEKLVVQGGNIKNSALASGIGNRCVYADSNGVLHIKSDDCGLAGASGDNLGSHTMTQNLRSSGYWISNSGASEGIFPLAGGNVGIGTSSPGARLDVQETNTSNSYSLRVGTSATAYHMVVSTMGNVGIGTTNPSSILDIGGTGAIRIPIGTAAERPTNPVNGMVRINTTIGKMEYYNNGWYFPGRVFATGGTITEVGGYRIHTFTSNGTFTPDSDGEIEVLVVAGGGGGGTYFSAGGGGAGGVLYDNAYAVSAQAYSITVGNGGAGAPGGNPYPQGSNGENSVFGSLTALGGGGGAGYTSANGLSGGSGGGSGDPDNQAPGTPGLGTVGQGNNGGGVSGDGLSGGGGGAGAVGISGGSGISGNGGNGISTYSDLLIDANIGEDIAGIHWIAGGGGGGCGDGRTRGTGGNGGGGNGSQGHSSEVISGSDGLSNTGGGGGGRALDGVAGL